MPAAPHVSVLVPYTADSPALARTLDALAAQDPVAGGVEVVVAMVGEPPPEPARPWPQGFTLRVVAPESSQAAATSNQLIAAASGKLIAWCQPGDTFLPGKLAEQASLLDEDNTLAAAFSFAEFRDADGQLDEALAEPFNVDLGEEELAHRLLCGNVLVSSTAMVRSGALAAVGPLDESLLFAQDFELWLRILVHGGIRIIPMVLSTCRVDGRELSPAVSRRVAQEGWQVICRHASSLMRRWPPLPQTNYAFLCHVADLATASEDWQVVIDYLTLKRRSFGHDDDDCLRIADCLIRQERLAEARAFCEVLAQERGRLAPLTMEQVERALAALPPAGAPRGADGPSPGCPA